MKYLLSVLFSLVRSTLRERRDLCRADGLLASHTNAISRGPTVAPVSSSAVFTAYTHPFPRLPVVYESIDSTDWFADRPSDAFGQNKAIRDRPGAGECHGRNGEQVDAVSDEGDQPVLSRLVADISGNSAQVMAEELAHARDNADGGGAGSERREEWTVDARATFIGHIGEEVDDAHR
jgi:hypothetical protein